MKNFNDMDIRNTVLTKTAIVSTAHGHYVVEYVVVNQMLTRIHTTVHTLPEDGGDGLEVGYITSENGIIFCNLTAPAKLSLLFSDFEMIVATIYAEEFPSEEDRRTNI